MAQSVLFVCTGNICRSPTAEGVFRHKAAQRGLEVVADSAGVSSEEAGNPPDPRAVDLAARRGYRLPARRARRIRPEDFQRFDLVLGMTRRHLDALERARPADAGAAVDLLMRFAKGRQPQEVPDPWYGATADFERALDMIELGVEGLLDHLEAARSP